MAAELFRPSRSLSSCHFLLPCHPALFFSHEKSLLIWSHATHPTLPSCPHDGPQHDTGGPPLSLCPLSGYGCLGTIWSSTLGLCSRWRRSLSLPLLSGHRHPVASCYWFSISGWRHDLLWEGFLIPPPRLMRPPLLGAPALLSPVSCPCLCPHVLSERQPHEDTHLDTHQGLQGLVQRGHWI